MQPRSASAGGNVAVQIETSPLSSMSFVYVSSVTLSLSFCGSFPQCSNLSTRTRDFWVLAHGAGGPGEWNPAKMNGPRGWDYPMKISVHFIHFYPLKKPYFSPVWHAPLSRWFPFEHCSTKIGSLDIELCTQHSVQVSYLNVQNSTSTRFSTAYEVTSCSTQLLTARTVQSCFSSSIEEISLPLSYSDHAIHPQAFSILLRSGELGGHVTPFPLKENLCVSWSMNLCIVLLELPLFSTEARSPPLQAAHVAIAPHSLCPSCKCW